MRTVEIIKSKLKANTEELLAIWNEYTSEVQSEDTIYTSLEELAGVLGDDAVTFGRRVHFGEVESWVAPYFALNAYGNIYSFGLLLGENSPIDLDELVTWLVDSNHEYITDVSE